MFRSCCSASVLEGENAILKNREIMGATNPDDADPGTIRKDFALSLTENSVHGSDAPDTAAEEISFWFTELMKSLVNKANIILEILRNWIVLFVV